MTTIVSLRPAASFLLKVAISRTVLTSRDGLQSQGGPSGAAFQEPSGVAARKGGLYLIFFATIERFLTSTSKESCEQNSNPSGSPHNESIVTLLPLAVAIEQADA